MLIESLIINSENRIFGNYGQFTIKLPFYMKNIKRFDIIGISIDNSQYLINSKNQKFTIYKYSTPIIKKEITLDIGDYDQDSLKDEIISKVNANDNDINLKITFDDKTMKYTFESDINISFDFSNSLSNILGFNKVTNVGNKLTSDRIVKLNKTNYYVIEFETFHKKTFYFNNTTNDGILINNDLRIFKLDNKISTDMIKIRITNQFNEVVEFNSPIFIAIDIYYDE